MTAPRPRLFNIPADIAFLPALVSAIDTGNLPGQGGQPPQPDELPRWTILVPNRRAARALGHAFLEASAGAARLLPRIRPIGDIDEDLVEPADGLSPGEAALEPAISQAGREFLLLGLIKDWAAANPQESLARDLAQSPAHRIGFAESLAQLLDRIETEGKDLLDLTALYDIDLATHRQALIGLLGTVREAYPRHLRELGLMDPTARRNALIRHQARLLAETPPQFPVIAAGSTGSIPATANLLGVIARLAQGAVILPGLDADMDRPSWEALTPQHPQFGLKRLLEVIGADRGEVQPLAGMQSTGDGATRRWFASEIMRPAETAPSWRKAVLAHGERLARALDKTTFCPMRSRREEAVAIAIILRKALETPDQTATLVTPDRDLARRVSAELRRWNIIADDSAGDALSRSLPGRFVSLLIDLTLNDFDPVSLAAFLHHPFASFGSKRNSSALRHLELAALRGGALRKGLKGLGRGVSEARQSMIDDEHVHPVLRRLNDQDWDSVAIVAAAIEAALAPLADSAGTGQVEPFGEHLRRFIAVLEHVAAGEDSVDSPLWDGAAGAKLAELFSTLLRESELHPPCRFSDAMLMINRQLRATSVRIAHPETPRISILGLLEARLLRSDVVILGGLNEGKWPAQPDPGPWVNRPMREILGMQMPERDIGLTAHDFVQALGAERIYLTWSERIEGAPAVPSRWIVTARMLIAAAKIENAHAQHEISGWVHAIDAPARVVPVNKPKPMPPIEARPKRLSVTEVETLIRDPYAIHAKKILRLEPLPELMETARHALRGSLIHDALDLYDTLRRERDSPALDLLREAGRVIFNAHGDDADIMNFWWPRYERLAQWFAIEDAQLRLGVTNSLTEQKGTIQFPIGASAFTLSARADRIDLFERGTARIVDYKTGALPGAKAVEIGFKPQLTLEAAILAHDGFGLKRPVETEDLVYMRLTGGEPPGELRRLIKLDIMAVAAKHLAELKGLLQAYTHPHQAYLPAIALERERDRGDFDHLARRDEWALSGEVKA